MSDSAVRLSVSFVLIAMIAAVLGIITASRHRRRSLSPTVFTKLYAGERSAFVLVVILCLIDIMSALTSGATSKRELVDNVTGQGFAINLLWAIFHILSIRVIIRAKHRPVRSLFPLLAIVIVGLLSWLVMGQREFIFGFGLVGVLLYIHMKPGFRAIGIYLIVIAGAIVIVPVTQSFKSVFLGQDRSIVSSLDDLFGAEFMAPGRNLAVLLGHRSMVEPSMRGLPVLVQEVGRGLSVATIGTQFTSLNRWFNGEFRPSIGLGGSSGWGFTLIGAGWMVAGSVGVAVYFYFLGMGLSVLYASALKSPYWFSVYLVIAPIIVYTLRQDLSYGLGALLKQALLPLLLLLLAHSVVREATVNTRQFHDAGKSIQ